MRLFGRRGRAPSAPPALPVLPFRPDTAPAEPTKPFADGDPVDALGACGVVLPGSATRWTGAVNHDILGDVHTAMLRRWNGRWEVELVTMGLDTLGLRVIDPLASPAEALEAAVDMTLYRPDLVLQCTTVDALVPHAASDAWLLRWD